MTPFVHAGLPARVVFGEGKRATLADEVARLGVTRAVVVSTPRHAELAEAIRALVGERAVGLCSLATMHTPVDVTETALEIVTGLRADGLIAVGGGSTIGLAKALALRTDLPQIALPTTFAGSEMTPVLGETRDGVKTTQKSARVLPEVVIYDVELSLTVPPSVCAVSGLNAIAHAVEALYAQDRNPVIDLLALEGISSLARALPRIVGDPNDKEARSDALYGAFLCGACLGAVGMALHHKLCHTLGGTFGLPHAETHAVVLPQAMAYNSLAVPDVMRRIALALGAPASSNAARAMYDLAGALGVKRSLRELGMAEDGIDRATDLAMANAYWNPRPLERAALRGVIVDAYEGGSAGGRVRPGARGRGSWSRSGSRSGSGSGSRVGGADRARLEGDSDVRKARWPKLAMGRR